MDGTKKQDGEIKKGFSTPLIQDEPAKLKPESEDTKETPDDSDEKQ